MRRDILLALCFLFAAAGCAKKLETIETINFQEGPLLVDLAQLKLEVTNTEVVDRILGTHAAISAKEGRKLVVVTLKGTVLAIGSGSIYRILIGSDEFAAIYEEEFDTIIEPSVAIAIDDKDKWVISGQSIYYFYSPDSTILKVVFSLPEKTTNFFVLCPTLTKGKATI